MKILYFSQVSWKWIKQRPHFIAEELAALGHDVIFKAISQIGSKKITADSNNLMIREITGVRGSAKYGFSRVVNGILTKIDLAGKDFDIIILTYPFQLDFLPKRMKKAKIVYDCMDLVSEFYSDKTRIGMIQREKRLCKRADAIVVSSVKIKETLIQRYQIQEDKITLIRNAYNRKQSGWTEGENNVSSLPAVKSPSMAYMGTIDHWIDFELLFHFCRKHEAYTLYLIGPVGKGAKDQISGTPENVVFTGALDHGAALELMEKIDIALIPFTVTELIKCVDPVKMDEYLSLNKPVVSSYWNELDHFENSGGIFFYQSPESFENAVQMAGEYQSKGNEKFLQENTWKNRAAQFEAVLRKFG